jgi:hypothetical protein
MVRRAQDKSVALKALGSLEAIPVTFEHLLAGSDVVETVKKARQLWCLADRQSHLHADPQVQG